MPSAAQAQEKPQSLSRLRSNELLPGCESPGVRSCPVFLLIRVVAPCQDQEKALEKYEAVVQSLQERSQQVLPLRFRRQPPPQPVPVEALCEYEGEQVPPSPSRAGHGASGGRSRAFASGGGGSCRGNEAKVALAPVRRAGFAAEEQERSGGDSAALSHSHAPCADVPACS